MKTPMTYKTVLQVLKTPVRCPKCSKKARWQGVKEPICSRCFMYDTKEGRKRVSHLAEFLKAVEAEGRVLRYDEEGRLELEDADSILGVIMMTSRMFTLEDRKRG